MLVVVIEFTEPLGTMPPPIEAPLPATKPKVELICNVEPVAVSELVVSPKLEAPAFEIDNVGD